MEGTKFRPRCEHPKVQSKIARLNNSILALDTAIDIIELQKDILVKEEAIRNEDGIISQYTNRFRTLSTLNSIVGFTNGSLYGDNIERFLELRLVY